jgi:glycosyltransferase involved in cell wall biosynthesis
LTGVEDVVTKAPRISVVVPVFNCEDSVVEALDSIFATGYPDLEVLVVDDGSSDRSGAILREYQASHPQRNLRLLQHSGCRNLGIVASRNLAIGVATGRYLSFLDADDTYYPNRFERSIPHLEAHPELDAVFEPFEYVFDSGLRSARLQDLAESRRNSDAGTSPVLDARTLSGPHLYDAFLKGRLAKSATSVTLRTSVFRDYGLFPETRIVTDRVLWLKLFASNRIAACGNEPVTGYRIHDQSICARHAGKGSALAGPLWALAHTYRWMRGRDIPPVNRSMTRDAIRGKYYQYCSGILSREHARVKHLVLVPMEVALSAPSLLSEVRWWKALLVLWSRGLLNGR